MKILAIEKNLDGVDWDGAEAILEKEAQKVFQLYLSGCLREIYFTENKNAVLILETENKEMAEELLNSLPLVKHKMIRFDIMELKPYNGFERLLKK